MSNIEKNNEQPAEKKKLSMQELVQQQLERKKQIQSKAGHAFKTNSSSQRMQSQQTKKPSNTRRKMGS